MYIHTWFAEHLPVPGNQFRSRVHSRTVRYRIAAFFVIMMCSALFSCDMTTGGQGLFAEPMHTVEVVLPPRPFVWSGIPSIEYQAVWTVRGIEKSSTAATAGSIWIEVPRGECTSVRLLATAVFSPEGTRYAMRPAGAVYPFDECCTGDRCLPDWEWGYVAEVAECLQRVKARAEDYNLAALSRLVQENSDPWTVPPEQVARLLASGKFSKTIFDSARSITVKLPEGSWFPEYPVHHPVLDDAVSNQDDTDAESGISSMSFSSDTAASERVESFAPDISSGSDWALLPGIHRFVGPSGIIVINVRDSGTVVMLHSGY